MIHRYILFNDQIRDSTEKLLTAGQVGLLAGWGVFSTLRVADGVLFAFERHWARMCKDAALFRVPMPCNEEEGRRRLLALVEANKAYNASLRVDVVRNDGSPYGGPVERRSELIAMTANLKQWGSGVKLAYVPQARHAASMFAGTKILSWAMNLTWLETAQARGFDEVILLNERGEVAECTAANIFCAREGRVLTPPLSSGCLEGVTRGILLEIGMKAGVPVEERTLRPEDLYSADEVLLSSTNRNLLAAGEIAGHRIAKAPGPMAKRLDEAFDAFVRSYISAHASAARH